MTFDRDPNTSPYIHAMDATQRCRSLAVELNNTGVALMADRDNCESGEVAVSHILGEAIRMMQMCLRSRRNLIDGIYRCEQSVETAEEALAMARQRLDEACDQDEGTSSYDDGAATTCCGPIQLSIDDSHDQHVDESSLRILREDCAVMMHNLALSHQRDSSSSASQFKALSYFEMALLLLQRGPQGTERSSPARGGSSSCGGQSARTGGSATRRDRESADDRGHLSIRLVVSSVSHSARIHGGLGNHSAAEEYGNELSRLLMMMSEEELAGICRGVDDNAAAAA
mmetsp:Transcript_1428/g.3944  ORF Transcript_1428/g.3944 Transcript_1428/m.3944 type:complete len:285 (-) Transcript_1428:194-1048(-)